MLLMSLAALAMMSGGVQAPAAQRPAIGTCIELDRVSSRIALAPDTLEFTMVGGRVLRNRLRAACPNIEDLDRFHTIQFDTRNGRRVCGGDRFRIVDQRVAASGGSASAPWCRFGAFELVSR